MNEEKTYYLCSSFFGDEKNMKEVYEALNRCMEYLDVPIEVSLIFDKESPEGRLILKKIN